MCTLLACITHHTPITSNSLPLSPLQCITKYNLIVMSLQLAQCDIKYREGLYSFIIFKDTLVNQSLLKVMRTERQTYATILKH